jgi:hypothetical protein
MKKWILGSLVGAIIVFVWQAASWMFLGIHDDSMRYLPAQDEIMAVLNEKITEEGAYVLPSAPTKKEQEELWKNNMEGKSWATIIYHKSFSMDMVMPMIRGFFTNLILVLLLVIILTKGGLPNFSGFFTGSLAVGVFTFLWGPYMGRIWYELPWHMIRGDIIDAIAAWGLCGLWLGWWMNRK